MTKLFSLLFEVANPKEDLPEYLHGMYAFTTAMEKVLGIQINWIEVPNGMSGVRLAKTRNTYTVYWDSNADEINWAGTGHDIIHLLTVNMAQHFAKKNKLYRDSKNNIAFPNMRVLKKFLLELEEAYMPLENKYDFLKGSFNKFKTAILQLVKIALEKVKVDEKQTKYIFGNLNEDIKDEVYKFLSRIKSNDLIYKQDKVDFLNTEITTGNHPYNSISEILRLTSQGYFYIGFDTHFGDKSDNKKLQYEVEETVGNMVADNTTIQNAITWASTIDIQGAVESLIQDKEAFSAFEVRNYQTFGTNSPEEMKSLAVDKGNSMFQELVETLKRILELYNQNLNRMGLASNDAT